jgi:hypothetical protein
MTDIPKKVLERETQSPEYIGRAIVNLALDPNKLKKAGKILEVGKLAREYNSGILMEDFGTIMQL